MKKLILLLGVFTLISCSRNSNNQDLTNDKKGYFVEYNVNNIQQSDQEIQNATGSAWTISSVFDELLSGSGNSYYIILDGQQLELDAHPLKIQTYSFDDNKSANVLNLNYFTFKDPATNNTYSYTGRRLAGDKTTFTMNITEVNTIAAKGTFSGTVVGYLNLTDNTARKILIVSNGSFYLPIEK